jgi:very-short-patch-repair endonuclease
MIDRIAMLQIPVSFSYDGELMYNTECALSCLECGYVTTTRFGRLLTRTVCAGCTRKLPTSISHAHELMTGLFSIVHIEGVKKRDRITLQCNTCNKSWETSVQSIFMNNTGCPYCVVDGRMKPDEEWLSDALNKALEFGGLLYNITYKNRKITYTCRVCETTDSITFNAFMNKTCRCKVCKSITKRHINYHRRTTESIKNKEFSANYASSYEAKVALILIQNNIKFETQKRFDIDGVERRKFDFYLPDHHCVIEVHGEQHYETPPPHWGTLEETQKNDKIKMGAVLGNDYKYIEIAYNRVDDKDEILEAINKPYLPFNMCIDKFEADDNGYFHPRNSILKLL